jgi:hypothetical protein
MCSDIHEHQNGNFARCQDFLHGGKNDSGSCCKRDEELYEGWCRLESSRSDLLWAAACDPTSSTYGQVQARLEWNERLERMALVRVDDRPGWGKEEEDEDASVMCEVRACLRASFECCSASLKCQARLSKAVLEDFCSPQSRLLVTSACEVTDDATAGLDCRSSYRCPRRRAAVPCIQERL